MKAAPEGSVAGDRIHRAAIIDDPCIVVVEGPAVAEPDALQDALELLVKWAVRAQEGRRSATDDARTVADFADCGAGEST